MSDKSMLTLIELLPAYAGIDERDVWTFSVPTVCRKSFIHSCYNMLTGSVWDTVADTRYFESERILSM